MQFADDDEPLPLRLFSIFEKSDDGWKMIALQESVAIDKPGVGANFKKVAAPEVKAEEPPKPSPKPKAEDKPKKKKKKR